MIRSALFFASFILLASCRPGSIEKMATSTKLIDASFSVAYVDAADDCRRASPDWEAYDACISPWEASAQALRILHYTTLALDATDRKSFEAAGCAWLRAVSVFDSLSPVDISAAKTALATKWGRRC